MNLISIADELFFIVRKSFFEYSEFSTSTFIYLFFFFYLLHSREEKNVPTASGNLHPWQYGISSWWLLRFPSDFSFFMAVLLGYIHVLQAGRYLGSGNRHHGSNSQFCHLAARQTFSNLNFLCHTQTPTQTKVNST